MKYQGVVISIAVFEGSSLSLALSSLQQTRNKYSRKDCTGSYFTISVSHIGRGFKVPPKSDRERSTESNLWCIKLLSKDAYLFKGVKKARGGTPYNDLYGEAPPERGTFFRLQVYKRVGISQVEVYKRVGKSIIYAWNRRPVWLYHLIYQVLHKNENKTSKSRYVKGVPLFNKRYIKGVPFLPKWYIKE